MTALDLESMTRGELHALLLWHVDQGFDLALDAEAHDRFADFEREESARAERARLAAQARAEAGAPPAAGARPPLPGRERAAVTPLRPLPASAASPEQAAASARELAAQAGTLDELRAAMEAFEGCGLKKTASRLVFADGNPKARVMFVGEAPGGEEDREGLPFVGPAGRLLDLMLRAVKLDRTQVYIANIVPWRPPGNRTPTPQEISICLPFLTRQIELVDPALLVTLGKPSTETLLNARNGIMRDRARAHEYQIATPDGPRNIRAFAMLHPAFLLRQPLHKRAAWRDMRNLRKALDALE